MRRSLILPSITLAVLVVAVTVMAAPPKPPYEGVGRVCESGVSSYTVVAGDSLAGKVGDAKWKRALAKLEGYNNYLVGRLESFNASGVEVLWIMPGEVICGMRESGVAIANDSLDAPRTSVPTTAVGTSVEPWKPAASIPIGPVTENASVFEWLWILIPIILFAMLAKWWWDFTHPTTAGEPIRRRGVDTTDPEDVLRAATGRGEARYGSLSGSPEQDRRRPRLIGNIESGVINGIGRVSYAGNNSAIRLMRNEPGLRAWFQMPNGTTEQLIFLQACINDLLVNNMRYLGYTFTPTGVAATIPMQEATIPAPTTPAIKLWGWEAYVGYRNQLADVGVELNREHFAHHLGLLRSAGWQITVANDILKLRQELIGEQADLGYEGLEYEKEAAKLREQADQLDKKAARRFKGASRIARHILGLDTDLTLFTPSQLVAAPEAKTEAPSEMVEAEAPEGVANEEVILAEYDGDPEAEAEKPEAIETELPTMLDPAS